MSKIPRRKKLITMDGAEIRISPLTYDEYEAYLEMNRKYLETKPKLTELTEENRKASREIVFFVVACGLSGADPGIETGNLAADVDDAFAAKLFTEVLEFTGLKVITPDEAKQQSVDTSGETKASS